jgi:hypothetical protein
MGVLELVVGPVFGGKTELLLRKSVEHIAKRGTGRAMLVEYAAGVLGSEPAADQCFESSGRVFRVKTSRLESLDLKGVTFVGVDDGHMYPDLSKDLCMGWAAQVVITAPLYYNPKFYDATTGLANTYSCKDVVVSYARSKGRQCSPSATTMYPRLVYVPDFVIADRALDVGTCKDTQEVFGGHYHTRMVITPSVFVC